MQRSATLSHTFRESIPASEQRLPDSGPRSADPSISQQRPVVRPVRQNPETRAVNQRTAAIPADKLLFRAIYRQMRSLMLGQTADLDDLVQTAMEQVLRALPRFEGRCELRTFTYRICYRTLMAHRRGYRRWIQRFVQPAPTLFARTPGDCPHPGECLEAAERARRLRAAVSQLAPKRRMAVVLCDLEQLGVEEAAKVVGTGVSTMRSRVRDGRRQLSAILNSDPYFSDSRDPTEDRI